MKGTILLQPEDLISNPNSYRDWKDSNSDCVFTGKIVGKRGDKDVKRIVQCLEKLQENDVSGMVDKTVVGDEEGGFGLGGVFEKLKLKLDADFKVVVNDEAKLPWDKSDQDEAFLRRTKKEKVVTKAEMCLDRALLFRLRNEARRMRKWIKVKKAGVTWNVVKEIMLTWKDQDLAMVKLDIPLCRNMDRAIEIIEVGRTLRLHILSFLYMSVRECI